MIGVDIARQGILIERKNGESQRVLDADRRRQWAIQNLVDIGQRFVFGSLQNSQFLFHFVNFQVDAEDICCASLAAFHSGQRQLAQHFQ